WIVRSTQHVVSLRFSHQKVSSIFFHPSCGRAAFHPSLTAMMSEICEAPHTPAFSFIRHHALQLIVGRVYYISVSVN
ncbi:hypothetical protein ACS0TA_24990, partial [Escherichia coli]